MNKIFPLLLLIILGLRSAMAQSIPCSDTTQLNTKLQALRDNDQNSRALFIKQMGENNPQKTKELALKMKAADKENQQFIAALLDNCGWPKGLSTENNHTIFLVIDHAEAAYVTKYFPLLKAQANLGVVQKNDLATLQDRILLGMAKSRSMAHRRLKMEL